MISCSKGYDWITSFWVPPTVWDNAHDGSNPIITCSVCRHIHKSTCIGLWRRIWQLCPLEMKQSKMNGILPTSNSNLKLPLPLIQWKAGNGLIGRGYNTDSIFSIYNCGRIFLTFGIYWLLLTVGRFGGVVVSVLATGPRGRGFEPGQGDGFLRAIKIRSTPSSRMGSKAGRSHVLRFYGM
jgi:hypothetical protein